MENRSHSRAASTRPRLRLVGIKVSELETLISKKLFNSFEYVNDESQNYRLERSSGTFSLLSSKEEDPLCFQDYPSNIKLILESTLRSFSIDRYKSDSKIIKKMSKLVSKKFYGQQKFILYFLDRSLDSVKDLNSVEKIFRFLQGIDIFKNYNIAQLLVLKKGHSKADSFSWKNERLKKDMLETKDFNAIFKIIKKSKNKSFDQKNILKDQLNLVGTFLAKEVNIKEFQFIFIVSRNELFPPSRSDKKAFEHACQVLSPHVFRVLNYESSYSHYTTLDTVLSNFPFPILIRDKEGTIVFKSNEEIEGHHHQVDLEGHQSFKASVFIPKLDFNIYSDYSHHQRIQLLGELLNTLMHELGNPLFGISLTSNLFDKTNLSLDSRTILQEISKAAGRCQKVLKNFSFLYRESESRVDTNLVKLITEIFTISKSETRGIERKIEVESDFPDEMRIQCLNPTLLTQVLFNLIINSAQSIKEYKQRGGEIVIKLSYLQQGNQIRIQVTDNGPGITEEQNEDIFKPFYTTKNKGTGLGLAICHKIMKNMEGEIYLDKDYSQGASFQILFPNTLQNCEHEKNISH